MASTICESDIETQKNKISSLIKKPLIKGDTWYLVDTRWYQQWKKYVGYDSQDTSLVGQASAHPGPVDNSALWEDERLDLKEDLTEDLDYHLVPEEAWNLFLSWYGLRVGQQPIARKVIEQGSFFKSTKVEIYLIDLTLYLFSDLENFITKQFSRGDSINYIETTMRSIFNIPQDRKARLWYKEMRFSNNYSEINISDKTFEEASLPDGCYIAMLLQNDDGIWTRQVTGSQERQNKLIFKKSNSAQKPQNLPHIKENTQVQPKDSRNKTDPIEELITCVVCFSMMQDPRSLPCQHTFCLDCLKKLNVVTQNQKSGFECPTCREFAIIQHARKSVMANQLIEIHCNKERLQNPIDISCSKHPNIPLEAKCVPCKVDICSKCNSEGHDTHKSETYVSAIQRNMTNVSSKISKISSDVDKMKLKVTDFEVKEQALRDRKDQLKLQIQKRKEELEKEIKDQYTVLLSEVDKKFHSPENDVSTKLKSLQKFISDRESFVAATSIGSVEGSNLLTVLEEIDARCDKMKDESWYVSDNVQIPGISFEKSEFGIETRFGKICNEN